MNQTTNSIVAYHLIRILSPVVINGLAAMQITGELHAKDEPYASDLNVSSFSK